MADTPKQREWQKENTVMVTIRLQKSTDADILKLFENGQKQTIIKAALREFIENHKEEIK